MFFSKCFSNYIVSDFSNVKLVVPLWHELNIICLYHSKYYVLSEIIYNVTIIAITSTFFLLPLIRQNFV